MAILVMDLTQIYAENYYSSARTAAYWIFTYVLYSTAYVITQDLKDSKASKQLKMKARTIKLLAFIPIIDTIFSIFYTFERRYSEASNENIFRSDWWKGLLIGLLLFIISIKLPIYPNTDSIAPSLTASTVYMGSVNNILQITVFTLIPLSILFDRKHLKHDRGKETGKVMQILSIIPLTAVPIAVLYLLKKGLNRINEKYRNRTV